MRIGILSDIHGNYPALVKGYQGCLERSDQIVCLGDIVDGFEEDDRCIDFLREKKIPCLLGNHDESCYTLNCPPVRKDNADYLRSLPSTLEMHGVFMIHDNPLERARRGDGMWREGSYIREQFGASLVFEEAEVFRAGPHIVVVGHYHDPLVFSPEEEIDVVPEVPIQLSRDKSYILNPGAIGYSRIRPDATHYGVLNTDRLEFCVYLIRR